MDDLFSSLAMQTVKLVGKAAFGAASSIAMKRVTEYMKSLPDHLTAKAPELDRLRSQFASKLRIVTPAIDLIEIIAARGHSTMASVLQLTHSLRRDIVKFTEKLETLERQEKTLGKGKLSVEVSEGVTKDLKSLLAKIEEAVPLLNLALTTSGAHLGGAMPQGVSPGRLMQASVLVARADERFEAAKEGVLVGEPLVLRLYSLFVGSVRPKSKNDFTWKEEYAKCQAELWRVPPSSSSADTDGGHGEPMGALQYELRIIEDLDDGRYHDEESAHDGKKVAPAAI
ncbi:Ran-specific GTPase-activating protein 30, partial [Linderina macrospora]